MFYQNLKKSKILSNNPWNKNGLFQLITVGNSIRLKWVIIQLSIHESLLSTIITHASSNNLESLSLIYLLFMYWFICSNVRTGIQWTTLFCVYFVMCGLIAQWPSEFNTSINRLIGDNFFVTKCIVKWAVIWWNLSSFEHLHFLIYPKCTFVRITAFSLLSMNNYTVL